LSDPSQTPVSSLVDVLKVRRLSLVTSSFLACDRMTARCSRSQGEMNRDCGCLIRSSASLYSLSSHRWCMRGFISYGIRNLRCVTRWSRLKQNRGLMKRGKPFQFECVIAAFGPACGLPLIQFYSLQNPEKGVSRGLIGSLNATMEAETWTWVRLSLNMLIMLFCCSYKCLI